MSRQFLAGRRYERILFLQEVRFQQQPASGNEFTFIHFVVHVQEEFGLFFRDNPVFILVKNQVILDFGNL